MEAEKILKNTDINEELTQKAKNDPKFKNYIEWLLKNGAKFDDVNYE